MNETSFVDVVLNKDEKKLHAERGFKFTIQFTCVHFSDMNRLPF